MDIVPWLAAAALPTIDESQAVSPHPPKQRLLNVLDQVEARVEKLRKDAARIEEEKDNLLATLDAIRDSEWMLELDEFERDEMKHSIERVLSRCMTVETIVHTNRDPQQEECLHKVNQFIDSLVIGLKSDPVAARTQCYSYMNACAFQSTASDSGVPADRFFESAILGCTLDDQKKVKKRLQGLLDYFARMNIIET
ncbi:BAG family molecular chaperone regulator 2 isoform X2 [Arctopsyche grandis]|uniref:BAG family molecular chaperone regulator 2 isoform X2 n=1 Tax=Arctopsyche grandis TaxID=121162 RepID=UPI00406D8C0B